jgi:histidine triad (HIT) family protein
MVAGEIPADVVHQTDRVFAFRDINPQAPVHLLIIPKEHIDSARSLNEDHADLLAEIFETAAHLAKANEVDRTGWRLVTNVGPDAGQSVHHLHFHLLGGRTMSWPPG